MKRRIFFLESRNTLFRSIIMSKHGVYKIFSEIKTAQDYYFCLLISKAEPTNEMNDIKKEIKYKERFICKQWKKKESRTKRTWNFGNMEIILVQRVEKHWMPYITAFGTSYYKVPTILSKVWSMGYSSCKVPQWFEYWLRYSTHVIVLLTRLGIGTSRTQFKIMYHV